MQWSRKRRRNIVLYSFGVQRAARDAKFIIDCWILFVPEIIVNKLVK